MNNKNNILTVRPLIQKMVLFIGTGISLIVAGASILLLIFLINGTIGTKLLMFLFVFIAFVVGYFLLAFPIVTRLIISKDSIFYKQPYSSILCNWENINGYQISDKQFFLKYDSKAKVSRNILGVFMKINRMDIPVHFFVSDWAREENWDKNEVLVRISTVYPNFKDIVPELKVLMRGGDIDR